ncbi:MAG: hypothetical protein NC307_08410 [Roseburia sp.]|nr:hypothetical protein [Roseburia sp.]
MKVRKLFLLTLCVFTLVSPTVVSAQNVSVDASVQTAFPGIELYGNQTGYIYRTLDGKRYKRLWSYTYGRWEEPYWTLA